MSYSSSPIWTILDASGDPVVSGTVEFYAAGTSTPKNYFTDEARATSGGTSATTDSSGRVGPIYLDQSADTKIVAKDSAGSTLWTVDNLQAPQATNAGVVSPLAYGAAGDGATDDSTAMQAAIDAATVSTIDLGGKTYKLDSQITLKSDLTIRNGTLDFTDLDSVSGAVSATGTAGSTITLTAGATTYGTSLTMDSGDAAGLVAGDWLIVFDAATSWEGVIDIGSWAHVKSISGGTVNIYDSLQTGGASCKKVSGCERMVLEDLTIITGAPVTNQSAIELTRCQDVTISRVRFKGGDLHHIDLNECRNVRVRDCETVQGAQQVTTFLRVLSGCRDILVTDCHINNANGDAFELGSTTANDLSTFGVHIAGCEVHSESGYAIDCQASIHDLQVDRCLLSSAADTITLLRTAQGNLRDCRVVDKGVVAWTPQRSYTLKKNGARLSGISVERCELWSGQLDFDDAGDAGSGQDEVDIRILGCRVDGGTDYSPLTMNHDDATNNPWGVIKVADNVLSTAGSGLQALGITIVANAADMVDVRGNELISGHASGANCAVDAHCDISCYHNRYDLNGQDWDVVVGDSARLAFIGNASLSTATTTASLAVTMQASAVAVDMNICDNYAANGGITVTCATANNRGLLIQNNQIRAGSLLLDCSATSVKESAVCGNTLSVGNIDVSAASLTDIRVGGNTLHLGDITMTASSTMTRCGVHGNFVRNGTGAGARCVKWDGTSAANMTDCFFTHNVLLGGEYGYEIDNFNTVTTSVMAGNAFAIADASVKTGADAFTNAATSNIAANYPSITE